MNITDIRLALADIGAPFGFNAYHYIPADPSSPALCVGIPEVEFGASLKRSKLTVPVDIVLSTSDMENAQAILDEAMSTQLDSLVDAYNGATSTAWSSCQVTGAGDARSVTIGSSTYLVATINLSLLA